MAEKKTAAPKSARSTKAAAENEPVSPAPEDTNTGPIAIPEPGASAVNEEFTAHVSPRGVVSIKPVDWVGPAPLDVSAYKIPALIDVLQQLGQSTDAPESDN